MNHFVGLSPFTTGSDQVSSSYKGWRNLKILVSLLCYENIPVQIVFLHLGIFV